MSDQVKDIQWILDVMPHRYPFLLVDRVLEIVPEKRLVALKNVSYNEDFFNGHFPDSPVMPGVLIIEGMAQAGGLLLLKSRRESHHDIWMYMMSIHKARFRRPVVPGDQLRYEIDVLRYRKVHAKLSGKAYVDDKLVAEAIVSSALVDR
jgi:beta-hydroxyacyl-ACP dehydratase FabZ